MKQLGRLGAAPLAAFTLVAGVLAGCSDKPEPAATPFIAAALHGEDSVNVRLATGDTIVLSEGVRAFYENREHAAAWANNRGPTEQGAEILRAISLARQEGLDTTRYRFASAKRLIEEFGRDGIEDEDRAKLAAHLDLLISEAATRYAEDLLRGMVDPEQAGLDWRIPRGRTSDENVLTILASGAEPGELFARFRPQLPYYRRFVTALAHYRDIEANGGWPRLPESARASRGDSSAVVGLLRRRLIAEGDPVEAPLAQKGAARPDVFDPDLAQAVKHFQVRHDLVDDGALGGGTLIELNHTVAERLRELQLNLDRWRWLPGTLGDRFILVNIAGAELEVVENDSAIMSMNVVVGQQGWETPVLLDTMEHVVFNPYWNVPTNIMKDEILPAIQRDPGFLARNNYEVVGGSGGSMRVRQRPGPGNALGKVKFLFPNSYDVYLHDTPADHLFSRNRRAFSHGCIRLERPLDLAQLVLEKATAIAPSRMESMLASSGERWVKLSQPIPVLLAYFTAWVEEGGSVRFHHDPYDHDRQLEDEVRRNLQA